MKKKIFLVLIVVLFIFSGCTSASYNTANSNNKKSDITIGIIYKTLDAPWFKEEGKAAKAQALKMGAKDVIIIDSKMNPDVYLSALDNLITRKVSGILVCVPDQKLSKITIDRCKKSNIPVIACDDPLTDDEGNYLSPFVGIDASKIGEDISNWMVDYLEKNKKLNELETSGLLLMSMDSVTSCIPRTEAQLKTFNKRIPDFPKENIFRVNYDGQIEKAFNSAASTILNNRNIKNWFVMAANDEGTVGAIRALEQANLSKNSVAVAIGGNLAKDEFLNKSSAFIATSYINPIEVGETSAKELMENILYKKKIPERYLINGKIITRDNFKDLSPR